MPAYSYAHSSGQSLPIKMAIPFNQSQTNYEDSLQAISIEYLYETNKTIQSSTVKGLHPNCSTMLDVLHDHLDSLITERYLMMLHVCYSHQNVCLDESGYNEILEIMEGIISRLALIGKHSIDFKKACERLEKQAWNSQRLTTDVYYLNQLEESIIE